MSDQWLADLAVRLPRHAGVIGALRDAVAADDRWRWFSVGCSLGDGTGDELSDIDCAVGYAEPLEASDLEARGAQLVSSAGDVGDMLVHLWEGMTSDMRRFAVDYLEGPQLDLVIIPADRMPGLRDGEVAIVDKDGILATAATHRFHGPPEERVAREWTLMAWWWVSDVAKYLTRGSLFEAAERIGRVRDYALRLFAAASDVPYASFGLTSLLDYEPFELPAGLAQTYPMPDDDASVAAAATAVAGLLAQCSSRTAERFGYDLTTTWETIARERLAAATS